METVPCPLCWANDAALLWQMPDRLQVFPGDFSLVRCCTCGLLRTNPRPSWGELSAAYAAGRYRMPGEVGGEAICGPAIKPLVHRITAFSQRPGRALDVGCGVGELMVALRQGGWTVQGVEPDATLARQAREQRGLDVFVGDLAAAAFPGEHFDLVVLWHVLEHLPEPLATLLEARRLLRPGGVVVVGVPNAASLQARALGRYWAGYDVPWHLSHFSPETLERLMGQAGLSVVRLACFSGSWSIYARSLQALIAAHVRHQRAQTVWRLVLLNPLWRAAVKLPFLALERWGQGPVLAAYGRKTNDEGQRTKY
jgi:SAM-dependent methyltransferase